MRGLGLCIRRGLEKLTKRDVDTQKEGLDTYERTIGNIRSARHLANSEWLGTLLSW